MTGTPDPRTLQSHYDILVIGAGLAGIGMAYHFQEKLPHRSYAILEARERLGGTWDIFKYPGLRSDVDMHLYGYSFAPWTRASGVASAANIMAYLDETASEFGIDRHIHYDCRAESADWDGAAACWTVRLSDGRSVTCNWLQMCGGYYSYESGYRPDFPGEEAYEGEILHPQDWPEDMDISGKRIVMIGSGATAVTILPELVRDAAHVTMLQRSPTYVFAGPREPKITRLLRSVLPQPLAYHAVRRKDLWLDKQRHTLVHHKPERLKRMIRDAAMRHLPDGFDFDTHFQPAYEPGSQRMCFAPDGDFYEAIARDDCEIVTDHIETFTRTGIRLKSGRELEADLVLSATGLNMRMCSGMSLSVDGEAVEIPETWLYRGIMLSGVPNFALTVGSLVHSYTLRVEMIADWVCRVMAHMDEKGLSTATPALPRPADEMERRPFTEEFTSGYLMRVIDQFPMTTSEEPWVNQQAYEDSVRIYSQPLEDGHLKFSHPVAGGAGALTEAA